MASYGVLRGIRYLQIGDVVPGEDGVEVRGRHVHHYVWGFLLRFAQGIISTALDLPNGDLREAVPFGAGVALVIDEFDILLQLDDWRWVQSHRPLLDAAVLGVAGPSSAPLGFRSGGAGPREGRSRASADC